MCIAEYEHKVGRADYRLCNVVGVEKDAKELVRTVMVAMRPRDAGETSLPYKSKKLKNLKFEEWNYSTLQHTRRQN